MATGGRRQGPQTVDEIGRIVRANISLILLGIVAVISCWN